MLEDEFDDDLRWHAAKALGKLGSIKVVPSLLKALMDCKDYEVREHAADALGELGSSRAVPGLLKVFINKILHVCERAELVAESILEKLENLESKVAIPHLLEALKDEDSQLRWDAKWKLMNLKSDTALRGLLKALKDKDYGVRWCALEGLCKLMSDAATPDLLEALEDEDVAERQFAANALGKLGDKAAIPGLIKALKDSNDDVCWTATEALGKLGDKAAIPGLIKALENEDEYTRECAVKLLSDLRSVEGLLKVLDDDGWDMLRSAVIALGTIGDSKAIPGLLKTLEDEDNNIRRSAAIALGEIKDDSPEKRRCHPAAHILPNLLTLIPTESGQEALQALTAIQANCQFYNYEISQLSPELAPPTAIDLHSKIDKIDQRTKQMAEQPSISIGTISGGIQNFTPNQGTQTNTNIGTQNNYCGADDGLKKQITDLNQFIAELKAKHPQVQTETATNDMIDAEIVAVQTNDSNRWQNLRQQMLLLKRQFFNPECQLQGLKAGVGEVAKHYLEDSVWAKAILTYIDKFSETPDQGA